MPPLAKTFVEFHSASGAPLALDNAVASYSKPPTLTASTSSGSNSTATTSTISSSSSHHSRSSSISSSSNSGRHSRSSVRSSCHTPNHALKSSLRAIVTFLEASGLAPASVDELADMISNKQFHQAMERALEYVECLLSTPTPALHNRDSIEALAMLFTAAWDQMVEYTQTNYEKARQQFARHENEQWQDFIGHQGLDEKQLQHHNHRRLLQWDPTQRKELINNLNRWTRAKMEAQKGVILNKEWTRYIKSQLQRSQRKTAKKNPTGQKHS